MTQPAAEEFTQLMSERAHWLTQVATASDRFQRGAAQLRLEGVEERIAAVKQRLIAEGAIFPDMAAPAPVEALSPPVARCKRTGVPTSACTCIDCQPPVPSKPAAKAKRTH